MIRAKQIIEELKMLENMKTSEETYYTMQENLNNELVNLVSEEELEELLRNEKFY